VHFTEHIVAVKRKYNGDIASLQTSNGADTVGIFFIDCSGFVVFPPFTINQPGTSDLYQEKSIQHLLQGWY
jgi:hypothetical protein